MVKKRTILLIILVLAISYNINSQNSNIGSWISLIGNKKFNDRWNIHHEFQYRNYNLLNDLDQILVRAGLGYNVTPNNNNLLLGYAFVYNEPYDISGLIKNSYIENRLFLQFNTKQQFGKLNLGHRYRIEQRYLEDISRIRLRYALSLLLALNKPLLHEKTLYLSGYNEVFINTHNQHFDRNRIYGGIGYKFNKYLQTELGFLNQYTLQSFRNQVNLIAVINY